MSAQERPVGVPDDLAPEQLERWSNGIVAFLNSEDVPQQFRAWAREQADLIDAHMASASDLEDGSDEDESEDADDEATTPAPVAPQRATNRARQTTARRRAARGDERGSSLRIPGETGKLVLGIVIGAVALVAIVGVRQMMSDDDNPAGALPQTADAPAFNQARADELEQILSQDPTNQEALFELGEMNFQAQRYEDMIPWFTKLVELDPANKHALTDLGTAHFNLAQPAEAKIWWEKVLAVDPNDVQAHYNLGFMYANAEPRDLSAAVTEWETVLRLDPESQLAQTARVHIDGLRAELAAASSGGGASATPAAATPVATAP